MKQIPSSFRNLLASGVAVEPFALAAIWHDPNALEDKIFTATRLKAADDIASSNDLNVRILDNKIALERGVSVPMASAVAVDDASKSIYWSLKVSEVGSWEWA